MQFKMLAEFYPVYVSIGLTYVDIISFAFNQVQMDAQLRQWLGVYGPSISIILLSFNLVILATQVLVKIFVKKWQLVVYIAQAVMFALQLLITIGNFILGFGNNVYPILSVTILLLPFVFFIVFGVINILNKVPSRAVMKQNFIYVCLFFSFMVVSLLYGNTIFHDAFSFSTKMSNSLMIAHRSCPSNGPEGTAYTIQQTCDKATPYAIELDIRLTKDDEFILVHDAEIDHYSDDPKFKGHKMIDHNVADLLNINIGERWAKADPYSQYRKGVPPEVLALTLDSAAEGIEAVKNYCKMENGSTSVVLFDIKDSSGFEKVAEVIQKYVDANPTISFQIRIASKPAFLIMDKQFSSNDRVKLHAAGFLLEKADFVSTIAFTAPLYSRFQHKQKLVSWTITNIQSAWLLAGTNSIVTTDYVNFNNSFKVYGGGYIFVVQLLILVFMITIYGLKYSAYLKLEDKTAQNCSGTEEQSKVESSEKVLEKDLQQANNYTIQVE